MEALAQGRKAKYNWPIIFADVDSGIPWRDVARKFSMPERVLYEKLRVRAKKMKMVSLAIALPDKGKPAPSEKPPQQRGPKPQNLMIPPPESLIPADFSENDLETIFSDPAAILALPPAEAEKLFGRKAQLMLAAALANAPEAKTLKDVATIHKIFRDASGLNDDKGKGSNGLLTPPRSFGRRPVTTIDVPTTTSLVEEPEGGWPEGME